ncbi:T9SS type A sorting domain-containing protein, partial [candidate division WOR-3 bacterium]|nr:T9SS type A sorting domain-containing protein [candidate division WOR-3 bacterium]
AVPNPGAPAGLVSGDLNNDGFPDLVSTNTGAGVLAVFLGNGDGTFDSLSRYSAGYMPFRARLSDFNEDGIPDVAAVNFDSANVVVYLGDGTGRLTSRRDYSVPGDAAGLLVADLNSDGHEDLAVTVEAGRLDLLPGTGTGTFGTPTQWTTGSDAAGLTFADLDQDNDLDVIVGRPGPEYITVMLNDNALEVRTLIPARHALGVPESTTLAAGFNLPLSPATLDSASFLAHGQQTGLHRGTIRYDSTTRTATLDPRPDFAAGEPVTAMLTNRIRSQSGVYLRGSAWSFTARTPSGSAGAFADAAGYQTGAQPRGIWCADFDGDGDIDIATTSNSPPAVCLLKNLGDGTFAAPLYTTVAQDPISLFGADFDSDGDMDLACFHNQPGTSTLEILANNGSGTFTVTQTLTPAILGQQVWGGDFDGDGDIDLVLTDGWGSQNNVRVLTNNGSGVFSGPVNYSAGSWARGVAATDADNDGDLDIVVTNAGNDNVTVLYNDGLGRFPRMADFGTAGSPDGIFANDLNGDNWVDMATAHPSQSAVSVLLNNRDGTFGPALSYPTRLGHFALDGADFDGDSDIDLVFSGYNADSAVVLLNDGLGRFGAPILYHVASPPWRVKTADFNLDGAIDLALSCYSAGSVSVLLATGLGLASTGPSSPRTSLCLSPNPSRNAMTITLTRTGPAGAELVISDVAGRLVRSYPVLQAQTVQVWDATDQLGRRVAPGIYFVRLKASEGSLVEKAVLTR